MKNLFLLLFLPFLGFAQSAKTKPTAASKNGSNQTIAVNRPEEGFTVSGMIEGLPDDDIKITITQGDKIITKTSSKNGAFVLKGSIEEPGLYWLTLGKEQPQYIFLENTSIKISGTKADIKKLKIEGSKSHNEFLEFQQIFNPMIAGLNAYAADINRAPEAKKEALIEQYKKAVDNLNTTVGKFVAAKKSSYVSLFALSVTMQANENIAEVEQRFNSLDEKIKTSAAAKELLGYINYAKVGSIGSDAIDFTQNDVNDKPVALSSFRGKYVLVDFWASWCRPCRMENPNVLKTYNKFKDKNFTVLGVSLDQQKEAWVKAIEKDKLSWTHVSDLQFWNNAAAQLYRVQSIPQNFLIDPAGKIVAKDLRGEDLEKKLCEYLGCSN